MKVKTKLKRIIIYTLVTLILFNFIVPTVIPLDISYTVHADTTQIENIESSAEALLNSRNNGIAGFLSWVVRILTVGTFSTLQLETFLVADSAGHNGDVSAFVTPLDIFFNKFTLTDINIFSLDGLSPDSIVYKIRTIASMFYYVVSMIAIAISIITLIVIGIRMVFANLAEEKAKIKSMLTDWVTSVFLIIFMSMIVIGIININGAFVRAIENVVTNADISNVMDSIFAACFSDNILLGIASTIVYVLMTGQTLIFLLIYIYRFFISTSLIVISSLVPLSYPIDKANGGKAESLNSWFSVFTYNVFIQSIHCLIYGIFIGISLTSLASYDTVSGLESLGVAIFAVASILIVRKVEELVMDVLGFKSKYQLTMKSIVNTISTAYSTIRGYRTNNMSRAGNNEATSTQGATFGRNLDDDDKTNQGALDFVSSKVQYKETQASQYESYLGTTRVVGENTTGGAIPTLLVDNLINNTNSTTLNDQSTEKLEEAVNNTKHDNINDEIKSTNYEKYVDNELDETDENVLEKFKKLYIDLKTEVDALNEMKKEIEENLKHLEEKIDKSDAETIRNNIGKLTSEEAEEYVHSLGNTSEGRYARGYLDYLGNKDAYNKLDNEVDKKLVELVNQGINKGIINKELEGDLLAGGSIGINALNKIQTIEGSNVEDLGEDLETTTELQLPQVAVQNALDATRVQNELLEDNKTVREMSIDTAKMLKVLEGEITVEGEFTDSSLTDFNIKILNKLQQGAYSNSNFKVAEAKVKEEGEEAVRKLEEFRNDQTSSNAKALTPAGKEYARLMYEANQAGLIVSSVRMMAEESIQVEKQVNTSFVQNITPSTNNVLDNLNKRKSAQG